jgi:hypothetical protein
MFLFVLWVDENIINDTTTNRSNSGIKTEFIRYIKYAGVFVKPKDMTRYSYNPYIVENTIFGISWDLILIWWYPNLRSILENTLAFANGSTEYRYKVMGICSWWSLHWVSGNPRTFVRIDPSFWWTVLDNQALRSRVAARHLSFFCRLTMNRKRGDEALAEPITTILWVALKDEQTERNLSSELSLELGRNSNFDELLRGCK